MKKTFLTVATILLLIACNNETQQQNSEQQNNATMETSTQKSAIEKLLFAYRDALNVSDVNKVLPLYAQEGVFMPTNAPTSIGQAQIKDAYEFVFKNIQLKIAFHIDEIVVNGDYAFARTTSKATTLIHATGQTTPEENRELFVLQKENGSWKIARYMFNKMK
ncbi:MAG: SgcJ/EcaC family oxidoreductase [Filimonas sp.]|nr:SgcJ/EcaC family oxidoreductase [Filimonas sp.]